MKRSLTLRAAALLVAVLLATGCSWLPGQAMPRTVDGVTVTCSINVSSIEGGNPGPESQTLCTSRAREAMGTVLATQPRADIESVNIAANSASEYCCAPGEVLCDITPPEADTLISLAPCRIW